MKRSEINRYVREALDFLAEHRFALPEWATWTPAMWADCGDACREIRDNALGWDVTDFGKGDFAREGLTLFTLRNGNPPHDRKPYCEKIMVVREGQATPMHFHWHKMEDIINRGGGELCMRVWRADEAERPADAECTFRIDGIETTVRAGETFRLRPGQSITFEPYVYHTSWAEGGDWLAGGVSTVNDDTADNRFYEPLGRYPRIDEDRPAEFLLCNEYPR